MFHFPQWLSQNETSKDREIKAPVLTKLKNKNNKITTIGQISDFCNKIVSGVILGKNWVRRPDAALDDLFFFFENLFYQNNSKEAMKIEGGQVRGDLINFFVVKKRRFLYLPDAALSF